MIGYFHVIRLMTRMKSRDFIILGVFALLQCGNVRADNAQYYYDPAGRIIAMIDPVNGSAQYSYDSVGNILAVVRRPLTAAFVAQLSPSRGIAGTIVTIAGTGFGTTANTTVSFNGKAAVPSAVTATQITVAVPSGATTGAVSVSAPSGTSASMTPFTVPAMAKPVISGFSPTKSDQGGTLTISGSGFDPVPANNKVTVNGRYAQVATAAATSLTTMVPVAGSGKVAVGTEEGFTVGTADLAVPPLPYLASNLGTVIRSNLGASPSVAIGTAGQFSMILFDVAGNQRFAIQSTASTFSSGQFFLYGPEGQQIGGATDLSANSFSDSQVLIAGGTYTALVVPANVTGSATLKLISVPADATATISANATPVSLTTNTPGQNIKLTFPGTAGQRVTLRQQVTAPLTAGCRPTTILQPDGTTQLYANGCFNYPDSFTDTLILPVAGTYTILFDPGGTSVGTATYTLYTVPADATATISANATPVSLTTNTPGQNIKLTFPGTAGQRVALRQQVTAPLTAGCRPTTILQPDGTTQLYANGCFNYPDSFTDTLILPVAGTYTILFDPGGTSAGTATYTLYDNTDRVATITPGGGSVSLSVTQPGQNGVLSFTGTQGTRVALLSQFDSNLTYGCSTVSIVQPNGTTQLYSFRLCGASVFSDPLPAPAAVTTSVPTLPVSGTYKVLLNPEGQITGTATFTLYAVPADVSRSLTIGQGAVTFTTTIPGQAIRVTFPGQASQAVTLNAGVVSAMPAAPCYRITLLAPDGTTVVRGEQGCASSYSSGSLSLPQAGTYTIVLDPLDVAAGSFSLAVNAP